LKEVLTKLRNLELPKAVKNVLLIVLSISIVNGLLAVLGASYLSTNTGTFLGKSSTVILSDLFFLEATVILAIGIFVEVTRAMREQKPISNPSPKDTTNPREINTRKIHTGMLLIIVGVILIGISVVVGSFK